MSLIYPNIVPENNLRLPDALTIKHGPAPLLSKFVLEGDKYVRDTGIRLRLRHDFDELVYVNKEQSARGNWFPLVDMFNPECTDLVPENSYWLSGERENGEIVLTWAAHVYYWPTTTLADEAQVLFCGPEHQGLRCQVSSAAARKISGIVVWSGSHWIHPDFRQHRLSQLMSRLGRAFAVARWPVDWMIALVTPALVNKGVASGYGYPHLSGSIYFPGSPLGDLELVLAYVSAQETYEDFRNFLAMSLSGSRALGSSPFGSRMPLDNSVTSTSPEPVFHGSSNRS
jgi:hypothetical protein